MSSSAAASSYWRVAGMSYLKYSNLCADMVRSVLKEPMRGKAKVRETVYFRSAVWKDGKPEKQGTGRKDAISHSESGQAGQSADSGLAAVITDLSEHAPAKH